MSIETPEYSQGVAADGAVILRNGEPLNIEGILHRLRLLNEVRAILHSAPELNPSNYDHGQVCQLNSDCFEAWSLMSDDDGV